MSIKWKRSTDGWILGVCEGLGQSFGINPNILRALLLLSMFVFGTGFLIYIILGFTLPKEDALFEYNESKFLGVCKRISKRADFELGLVRTFTVFSFFISVGATLIFYIVLNFVLPKEHAQIDF
jgi:phage shock protein PspC (stress-responsive transcriptional regulator)